MRRGESADLRENEAREFADFAAAIGAVEHDYEFVVIDTPASDSYLMRLAHSLADTLISPLNDSYIDVDVFSRVNHDRKQRGAVAHYADLVIEARRKRQLVDNGVIDWVMVRNRMASLANNNAKQIAISIARLGAELRFRVADGFHDRVIFRELFPDRPDRARSDRARRAERRADLLAARRAAGNRRPRRIAAIADAQRRASSISTPAGFGMGACRIFIAASNGRRLTIFREDGCLPHA